MSQQKTFVGFTPTPLQKNILNGVLLGSEKYHIVSCGRQIGKTMLSMNLVMYWALNNGPCKIMWVSPVYSMCQKVMKDLMSAIGGSGVVKSANYSANEIILKNGSQIIFRSSERYDAIRGYTIDFAVLDEFAYMKEEAWTEAIKPTLLVKGRKVLFTSTPRGKTLFYELFLMGQSEDYPQYKSYTGSSYDSPFINPEEIEEAKRTLPEAVFRQEYMAEFIDSGGEVFTDIDKNCFSQWPKGNGPYYAAADIARAEDFTVMTVMDREGQIVEMYRKNNAEWNVMVNEMVAIAKKWNATVMVEENGVGSPIFEMFKRQYQNVHPFMTTNKSKNEVIEGLILDMNESTIKIPSKELFPALYNELSIFTYTYNPKTRSISYGHPNGAHDDTVIATAICNYNRKVNKQLGSYNYIKPRR